ncbi:MAG TPA: PQQ-binding-like beta-propeller repeat protein, partial [Gemmataceae bacterium]|nr:PQQ-binding-like beta-propeller repeat protein [Gemmataceae bacterium]
MLLVAAVALILPHIAHAQTTIGWRTDGTGCYPKAQPPLEWSTTKNVVWSTAMPGYGVSHPVLLGKYVFTCSEPGTLLCVNRDDGKIIWQKTCN